jgi:hypothetical protein
MNMDMSGLPPGLMQMLLQMMQQGGNWGQTRNLQDQKLEDPLGWNAWLTENHQPEWQPGKTFSGQLNFANPGSSARVDPYYTQGLPQLSNVAGFSRTLSPEEIAQFQAIPDGTRGDALRALLPERFRNTAEANRMISEGNNTAVPADHFGLDWRRLTGVSGPEALKPVPLHKYDYAAQYGYEGAGAPEFRGQQWSTTGQPSPYRNDRHVYPDAANIIQTLKGAGWDPDTQGWGPQEWEGKSPEQQTMLNDLVYSISPKNLPLGTSHERMMKRREEAHDRFLARQPKEGAPSWVQDPWAAMQGVTDRNAYVNDTLGGNFYGGVIPDDSMQQTWGRHPSPDMYPADPHFSQPQRTNPWSVESPNDATYGFDAYPGWATNPSNSSFGNSPWGAVGEHSWQPPQQAPAWKPNQNSAWGGNQKGSANASPWGNNKGPWG